MSDIAAIRRQLKIKTGVVSRLSKETKVYREETGELERKLNKLKRMTPTSGISRTPPRW